MEDREIFDAPEAQMSDSLRIYDTFIRKYLALSCAYQSTAQVSLVHATPKAKGGKTRNVPWRC